MTLFSATALHQDPGLQPERTVMSWDRSLLALMVTSAMFLRWYGTAGPVALAPAVLCAVAAFVIHWTQRHRYGTHSAGIARERVRADAWAVLWLVALVTALAALGIVAIWWA
jgi:hypothetical protein